MDEERVIDVVGLLRRFWQHKWVWLVTFLIVTAAGAGYVLLRPTLWEASQKIYVAPHAVESEAEAIQQQVHTSAALFTFVEMAHAPEVVEPLGKKYPELVDEEADDILKARLLNVNMFEITVSSTDKDRAAEMVTAVTNSYIDSLPEMAKAAPKPLMPSLHLIGEPVVEAHDSGKVMGLGVSMLFGMAAATVAVAGLEHLRGNRTDVR